MTLKNRHSELGMRIFPSLPAAQAPLEMPTISFFKMSDRECKLWCVDCFWSFLPLASGLTLPHPFTPLFPGLPSPSLSLRSAENVPAGTMRIVNVGGFGGHWRASCHLATAMLHGSHA